MPILPLWSRAALAALALGQDGEALAGIYRCEKAGQVQYSDTPCPDKSSGSRALDLGQAGSTGLRETASLAVKTYDVHGQSLEQVLSDIAVKGPKGYHGMATWKIDYAYTWQRTGDTCRIISLELKNEGTILMPKWVEAAQAPRDQAIRWDRMMASLRRHEDGHIAHATEFQTRVRQDLMSIAPQPCEKLEAVTRQTYDRLHKLYVDKDIEYDRRTRHGQTQDAPR